MSKLKTIPTINYKKRIELATANGKRITPSEKHSAALRKKLARGTPPQPEPPGDCFDCEKACGLSVRHCAEPSLIGMCANCGMKARYRLDPQKTWKYCETCRANRNV